MLINVMWTEKEVFRNWVVVACFKKLSLRILIGGLRRTTKNLWEYAQLLPRIYIWFFVAFDKRLSQSLGWRIELILYIVVVVVVVVVTNNNRFLISGLSGTAVCGCLDADAELQTICCSLTGYCVPVARPGTKHSAQFASNALGRVAASPFDETLARLHERWTDPTDWFSCTLFYIRQLSFV
jgi:hypothetical protein